MKKIGNRAHLLHAFFKGFGALDQQSAVLLAQRPAFALQDIEVNFHAGEILAEAIVEFAADMAALVIL